MAPALICIQRQKKLTTAPGFSASRRQSNDFSTFFSPMFFPHRHKIPSSDPIFLLSETSSHRFPRYSTLISPAAAEELTMKPRCAGFHRQFSPIPRNFPELEVHAPPEPEANHGPPKTFTGFGYAQRAFHAAEPAPKGPPGGFYPVPPPIRRIFPLLLEIQQINPI